MKAKNKDSGKLRIGDDWNAIRIIALSQSSPIKAIAECVENSLDARAKKITITRGKAELYLAEPNEIVRVALSRAGTRVIEDLSTLPGLEHIPWGAGSVTRMISWMCWRSVVLLGRLRHFGR